MLKKNLCSIALLFTLLLTSCNNNELQYDTNQKQNQTITTESSIQTKTDDTEFQLKDVPEYSGTPYVEINNNKPFFTDDEKTETNAFEQYSQLDHLGRCGVAYANVCKDLQPTTERGQIGSVKPSGWQTSKYNGYVEGNYLYNRCHLIGYQLTGENANALNLITGTRYMNCDGQLPFENKIDNYIDKTNNHVLYRVTPIFDGDNLVASGVLTEAYSVEDKGKLQFCVYCYNVQPGITINYTNGDNMLTENYTGEYATSSYYTTNKIKNYNTNESTKTNIDKTYEYIINTNTNKFHDPNCTAVKKIKDKHRKNTSESKETLLKNKYEPCGLCKPN